MENEQHIPDAALNGTKKGKGKEWKSDQGAKVKAIWNDKKHAIFVRICVEQMRLGNKPHHTLNKEGYINLEREFLKETGYHYSKAQFKNHWDNTRRDWKTWNALKNSTGILWDEKKNTYSQTSEWWADFEKQFPGGKKFADQPLAHVEDLNLLFEGGVDAKDMVFVPGSEKFPQECAAGPPNEDMVGHQNQKSKPLEDDEVASDPTDSTSIPISPICSFGFSSTPVGRIGFNENGGAHTRQCPDRQSRLVRPEKRLKTTGFQRWEASLKQFCDLLAERTKRPASSATTVTEESNPISKAIDLLNEIVGIERNSDEWLFAASLLRDQSTRQLFVALGNPESRGAWIKREYRLAYQ